MRKIVFYSAVILFLLPGLNSLKAQESAPAEGSIKWYSFEEAIALSEKKPKKLFLDMYTDWCGWCKRMDQTTFKNPVVAEYMNENFYAVKFNAERKDSVDFKGKTYVNSNPAGNRSSHQLAQALMNGRMSYPSFVFMNENQEVITIVPGYRKAPEMEAILNYIGGDSYKDKKWEEFAPTFQGKAVEEQ